MLDDLVSVIETLQQRIRDYGTSLRENETRTRMALIDPLLTALGWDVSDPALVTPEYNAGTGRRDDDFPDYALLRNDTKPVALVEAKRLGTPLRSQERQLFGYCNKADVEFGVLTDGSNWRLYEMSKSGDKLIDTIPITGTTLMVHQIAMRLLPLWYRNLIPNPSPSPGPVPNGGDNPRLPESENLSSYNPERGARAPTSVRFPGKEEHDVKNWRYLMVEAVKWLWSQGLLTENMVPVRYSRNSSRFSVNSEPVHGTGAKFFSSVRVEGTPFYIEGQGGVEMPGRVRSLLNHCGVNPGDVWLKVDP